MKTFADLKDLDKRCGEFRKNYYQSTSNEINSLPLHERHLEYIKADRVNDGVLEIWQSIIKLFKGHFEITDECRPLSIPDDTPLPEDMVAKMLALEAYIKENKKDP